MRLLGALLLGVALSGAVEAKTLADKCEAVGGCQTVKADAIVGTVKTRPTKAKISCHKYNYKEDHSEYTQIKMAGYLCNILMPDGEEVLLEIHDDMDLIKLYKSVQDIREKLPRPKDGDLL